MAQDATKDTRPQDAKSGPGAEQIAAWKQQHGDVSSMRAEFVDDDGREIDLEIYVRKPQRMHYDRLLKDISLKPGKAMVNFILSVLLWPSSERFRQLCEKYPGISASLGAEMSEGMGFQADVIRKKL
ncbi:MAG: hypothetical protein P9M14_06865 [Candidatus Alcyoniella australis]|nr:hypothetical protein [Candidatus Alcyoniella australis]